MVGCWQVRIVKISLRAKPLDYREGTGRSSELNIFNSSLSDKGMIGLTKAGGKEFGALEHGQQG